MNNNELLRKKLQYATPEELLFILLNDTDMKFKKVIKLWKDNNVEGTVLSTRLADNILYLKNTLNTNVDNSTIKQGLHNIENMYGFICDEIFLSSSKKDYERLEKAYEVFLIIKNIFEEDRKNTKSN